MRLREGILVGNLKGISLSEILEEYLHLCRGRHFHSSRGRHYRPRTRVEISAGKSMWVSSAIPGEVFLVVMTRKYPHRHAKENTFIRPGGSIFACILGQSPRVATSGDPPGKPSWDQNFRRIPWEEHLGWIPWAVTMGGHLGKPSWVTILGRYLRWSSQATTLRDHPGKLFRAEILGEYLGRSPGADILG